jgi:hypothetical protein
VNSCINLVKEREASPSLHVGVHVLLTPVRGDEDDLHPLVSHLGENGVKHRLVLVYATRLWFIC